VLLIVLAATAAAYEKDGEVLVLHDADFPQVVNELQYVMLEFYAPWCGHCKKLEPIYKEAAAMLAERNSPIKLAKINSIEEKQVSSDYGVQGFPTLYFMLNGTKVKYNGDRTKEAIVGWVEKKIYPSTREISLQEELDNLKNSADVHLVLFSNNTNVVGEYKVKATEDDYNKYLVATGDLLNRYPSDTVEIHRNFGEVKTHSGIEERFQWWVGKYSRPLILPFDDRTVKEVFNRAQNIILIFNSEGLDKPIRVAKEVANDYLGEILISEVRPGDSHFAGLSDFFKVRTDKSRIVGINSKQQKKAIYWEDINSLTYDDLWGFIESIDQNQAELYPMEYYDSKPKAAENQDQPEQQATE